MHSQHVLGVVPARAGSKGITNKNVRIAAGRPLAYYAIRNALDSELVIDVVDTTDSDQVRIIAEQMGARVRIRVPELCADDVTLDAVVWVAAFGEGAEAPEGGWGYVVAVQPVSPTLSVVNDPRLSWVDDGEGGVRPNCGARMNRQWLPADYAETGRLLFRKHLALRPRPASGRGSTSTRSRRTRASTWTPSMPCAPSRRTWRGAGGHLRQRQQHLRHRPHLPRARDGGRVLLQAWHLLQFQVDRPRWLRRDDP